MSNKKDIFDAISSGTVEDIRYFIEDKKVGFNIKNDMSATPLYTAAVFNNTEAVKYLISAGANVNEKDGGGGTPLHEAVRNDNIELVKWLISKGANINAKAMDGKVSVFDMAKSEEMIQYLKNVGNKNASTTESNDVLWEKRQKKILLICSLIGLILGTIVGVIVTMVIEMGDMEEIIGAAIAGMWMGTGLGSALSYLPVLPSVLAQTFREEGFIAAIKTLFFVGIIGFIVFSFIGPIGFLIRLIKINIKIKNLQKNN